MTRKITEDDVSGMQEVKTQFWKPEEKGDGFVGVPIRTVDTQHGTAVKVETEAQGHIIVDKADLNEFLEDHIGRKVAVAFKGKEKMDSGNDMFRFEKYAASQ